MAIRRQTLRLAQDLRVAVGAEADQATRDLTVAWARAWNTLAPDLRAALLEAAALAVELGRWPRAWELQRINRLAQALVATQDALAALGERTGVTVTAAAGRAVEATADAEPRLIASQLPAAERAAAAAAFADKILPSALDTIVARTTGQITAASRPLSAAAMETVRRELVRGVAVGSSPRETARLMLARTEGAFNGGLSRAMVIARTETLDAHRAASSYAHAANRDVLDAWVWHCRLDRRSCPSCWAMHGSEHPLTEPGPLDHQQGRCARLPKVKSWRDLGIGLDEPSDLIPDAKARFNALPDGDQLAVMGAARLELLRSGRASWEDLATRRTTAGWRDSYAPTPVKDLARAGAAAAA